MTAPRSKLFIPGDRLDGLANALDARPDALSFDLEDGVAEAGKAAARQAVADILRARRLPPQVWVRINAVDSGHTVAEHVHCQATATRWRNVGGLGLHNRPIKTWIALKIRSFPG